MPRLALLLPVRLAACGPGPLRIAVPPLAAGDRIGVGVETVEVVEVSLPSYADGEDIFVQQAGFVLTPTSAIWADDPARALTLEISRALNAITAATVAPEPWPFEEEAQARLDIRVEEFAPDVTQNAFILRGQYFVGGPEGSGLARARGFRVAAPLPPDAGPAAIAAARAQAAILLAREIAANGLSGGFRPPPADEEEPRRREAGES
jgi:hypothetical protein